MPRTSRNLANNEIYHILNRGNQKQKIFHGEDDYRMFLHLMKKANERFPVQIFAYCLMPNHFHYILRCLLAKNISKWMQWLMTSHISRYRKKYKTNGHIWQGRYKNFIIQENHHLLTVLRYVERNPVTAGLVKSAENWPWSSHKIRIGLGYDTLSSPLPIALPADWNQHVNKPLTDKEYAKLKISLDRQTPFGETNWQEATAKKFNLKSTLNKRGRPKKGDSPSLI